MDRSRSRRARGELEPLLTEYRWPEIGIYAMYPPTRFLSRRVRDFVYFLSERFAGEPYWSASRLSASSGGASAGR